MLNDFSEFIYELESCYIKELDCNLILNFIEKFYKDFLNKNNNIEINLLNTTINTIIVAVDSIILKKSSIKDRWIHRTAEHYLLNLNRGNETIDNTIKNITNGTMINEELNTIIMILLLNGIDSPYKKEFIEFFKEKKPLIMNVEKNILISSINREKKKQKPLLYIFIITLLIWIIITEVYYFISLSKIVKSNGEFLLSVRGIYGI